MQMRDLECFLAVAEELHFSRAAKRLHLSQPPLSKHIYQLETELGVRLFDRNRRSVRLTEAGKVYCEHVQDVFRQLEQAKLAAQRAHAGKTGMLRIGFIGALFYDFLPSLLLRYRRRFPDVQIVLQEMLPTEQLEALSSGRLDVAFPGLAPGRFGPGLVARIVGRDRWFAAFHQEHPLARQSSVSLKALRNQPFVLIQRSVSPAFDDKVLALCSRADFVPKVVQTSPRAQTLLNLIAAGVGISLFPETIGRLPAAGLVFVPLRDKAPPYEHAMVWNVDNGSAVLHQFLQEEKLMKKRLEN